MKTLWISTGVLIGIIIMLTYATWLSNTKSEIDSTRTEPEFGEILHSTDVSIDSVELDNCMYYVFFGVQKLSIIHKENCLNHTIISEDYSGGHLYKTLCEDKGFTTIHSKDCANHDK